MKLIATIGFICGIAEFAFFIIDPVKFSNALPLGIIFLAVNGLVLFSN